MLRRTIIFLIVLLLLSNVYIFVNTIRLGGDINHFEKEIKTLHQENLSLENEAYQLDSLQYAASLAAELDFSKKSQPFYLESLKYALKPNP
ncbi:hypothetical protein HYW87_00610 [Candidatus Roizmanbacteria bacterium]|nr:hypothetical protein [Candidatus Roizmanbacteria bacterium]